MSTSLGRIFGSAQVLYDDVQNSGVLDPVGTSAFTLQGVSVDAGKSDLKVFDLSATLGADSSATVSIDAATATITPFDSSTPLSAPSGDSYAVLHVDGKLSAGASGSIASTPLSLSAAGATDFDYDYYLPVAATQKRLDALTSLITTAQLPQLAKLDKLETGAVASFEAALNFDLGLKATFGKSFDIYRVLSLFDGLSATFKASVQASLEATLGWTIYDDMEIVVARAQTNTSGWVRIRLDRAKQDSLTLGATFALQANYDASSLETALEKAFDMTPLPRAISILTTVSSMTWDEVKTKVTDRVSQELISLIAGTGWQEKAADSQDVTEALAAINKVVSIYNSVPTKVQQLWSALLLRVDAGPDSQLQKTLTTISSLDPSNPDLEQFLSPTAQKDLDMLESLTGKSIDQLLIGNHTGVQNAITKAVSLAKEVEGVLTDTPGKITAALQQFATNTGIKSAVTWLATNATSLDAIANYGDAEIEKLVSKAV
ncbi:MAG: hypothetical protein ACLGH0_14250, partial [Thermoanaerobaculia bacterium]